MIGENMKNTLDEIQLGVTFGFRAKAGYFESEEAQKEADAIIEAGIEWVTLVPTVYHETWASTLQFIDFELTPGDFEIADMIDYFHSHGVKVQLRPMLEGLDGSGRMEVSIMYDFSDRMPGARKWAGNEWFASMKARSIHYAKLAERTGCELFCIDSELDHVIDYNDFWHDIIHSLRKVYSGPITSCHTIHVGCVNYEKLLEDKSHWFYDLDVLSISAYMSAASKGEASTDEMKETLCDFHNRMENIAKLYGKPLLLGEIGCRSCFGSAAAPWDWRVAEKSHYDGAEQANYLRAIIELFMNDPWWRGLCWWKWDEQVNRPQFNTDKTGNMSFSVKGKPALGLFKEYTQKLRSF